MMRQFYLHPRWLRYCLVVLAQHPGRRTQIDGLVRGGQSSMHSSVKQNHIYSRGCTYDAKQRKRREDQSGKVQMNRGRPANLTRELRTICKHSQSSWFACSMFLTLSYAGISWSLSTSLTAFFPQDRPPLLSPIYQDLVNVQFTPSDLLLPLIVQ